MRFLDVNIWFWCIWTGFGNLNWYIDYNFQSKNYISVEIIFQSIQKMVGKFFCLVFTISQGFVITPEILNELMVEIEGKTFLNFIFTIVRFFLRSQTTHFRCSRIYLALVILHSKLIQNSSENPWKKSLLQYFFIKVLL